MANIKYGYRQLSTKECTMVKKARDHIDRVFKDLDGLPIEPVKERTIRADLEALDGRLYEVQRQLGCRRDQ